MKKIRIQKNKESSYTTSYYPLCPTAFKFTTLLRVQQFSLSDIEIIGQLGFIVEIFEKEVTKQVENRVN